MADDPLDQTARDGGRPKHEPPTIDLEAADVSDGTTTAPAAASRAPMLGLLTPLLSGAVAALAVCGALWAGGVIGLEPQTAPPLAVSPADHAALVAKANDLTTRLAKLEARPQPANSAPSPAVDPARLAATEKSLTALREDIATLRADLARRPAVSDAAPAPAANAAPEIAALGERVAKLEQTPRVEAVAAPPPPAHDDLPVRRATVASALDAQVQRGEPYAPLLAAAKQLAPRVETLAPLDAFAADGLPSDAKLARDLLALLPQLAPKRDAAKQDASVSAAPAGFLERLQANAAKLVHVERVEAGSSAAAPALGTIEAAAKRNDIAAARREINQLPPETRALAKSWIDTVDARAAARAASRQFSTDAMAALARPAR